MPDPIPAPTTPITTASTIDLRDPFQGFDIKVLVREVSASGNVFNPAATEVLGGAFTGFMCRITCQTEAYLPLGQRTPRMLDGELIVVWSLEQAMVNSKVMAATFGTNTATAYAAGRGATPIPRQRRFNIEMEASIDASTLTDMTETTFNAGDAGVVGVLKLDLFYARVDTGSFGVMAGKRMASSSWQGVAEFVKATKS